jgi:predicted DNA-binding WGR domain protein
MGDAIGATATQSVPSGYRAGSNRSDETVLASTGMKVRLELIAGRSKKFWEANVVGNSLIVTWGRIGTSGQSKTQAFRDAKAARADQERQSDAKLAKGYRLVGGSGTTAAKKKSAAPAGKKKSAAPAENASKSRRGRQKPAIVLLSEAQKSIVDACKVLVGEDPSDQPDPPPKFMNGKLYNVGFAKGAADVGRLDMDSAPLVEEMRFLERVVNELKKGSVIRSSNRDEKYHPIILHERIGREFQKDLFKALNVRPDVPFNLKKEGQYPRIRKSRVFNLDAFMHDEKIDSETQLKAEGYASKHIRAVKTVHALFDEYLANVREFAVLTGYDTYPEFMLGKSPHGRWIGLMTASSNPDIYGNDAAARASKDRRAKKPKLVVLSLSRTARVASYFSNQREIPRDGCVLVVPNNYDCDPLFAVRAKLGRANLPKHVEAALVDAGDRFVLEHPDEVVDHIGRANCEIVFTNAPRAALQARMRELQIEYVDADELIGGRS